MIEENAESLAAKLRELMARPEAMKRVGETAQREIYVSWESAVAAAYDRYGAVIENYQAGRYPAHDHLSDEFFRSMASAMDLRARRREAQRQLLEEVRRSRDALRNELSDQSRRLSDQWEAQSKRLSDQMADQTRRFNEQVEKLYQYLDRFL